MLPGVWVLGYSLLPPSHEGPSWPDLREFFFVCGWGVADVSEWEGTASVQAKLTS